MSGHLVTKGNVIFSLFQTGSTELPAEDDNTIREYLCIQAYLVSLISVSLLSDFHAQECVVDNTLEKIHFCELCINQLSSICSSACLSPRAQEAHDAFNDWFEHYHNAKPAKPEAPHKPSFTERVAFEHQQKQFEAELARWQHSLDLQSKVPDACAVIFWSSFACTTWFFDGTE